MMKLLLVGAAFGVLPVPPTTPTADAARLSPGRAEYRVHAGAQELGSIAFTLKRDGAMWVDELRAHGFTLDTRFDERVQGVEGRLLVASGPGETWQAHAEANDGRIVGHTNALVHAGRTHSIDVAGAHGATFSPQRLLEADSLWLGRSIAAPVFQLAHGTVTLQEFHVVGEETVTVPAGSFEVFRVEAGDHVYHVTRRSPHRLVAEENLRTGVRFELKSWQPAI